MADLENRLSTERCSNLIPGANLSGCDLSGFTNDVQLQFIDMDLSNANLFGMNNAILENVVLQGTNLSGSTNLDIINSDASGSFYIGGSMLAGVFQNVDFTGADLRHSSLDGHIENVNFQDANLTNTGLSGLFVGNVNFQDANLDGVILRGAEFVGVVDFTGALNQPTGEINCKGTPIGAEFTCTG